MCYCANVTPEYDIDTEGWTEVPFVMYTKPWGKYGEVNHCEELKMRCEFDMSELAEDLTHYQTKSRRRPWARATDARRSPGSSGRARGGP